MDDELFAIGDVARRTGLAVRTIRFYADQGIVTPQQSPAGYRLFDLDTVARLDLVRTLRELGLPLSTIRRVLQQEATLAQQRDHHLGRALERRLPTFVWTATAEDASPRSPGPRNPPPDQIVDGPLGPEWPEPRQASRASATSWARSTAPSLSKMLDTLF